MSSDGTIQEKLDDLFPAPSAPPSQLSPQRLPGSNLDSLAALQYVLKDNHQRYHIFFNNIRHHNHVTHRALAIYALGAPAAVIRDYYQRDADCQRPAFESPEPITEENFIENLGDERFYQSYISFFSDQVSEKGAASTLEEFLFSDKYNFQRGRDVDTQPEMLARLFAGLAHSLIHVGYGVEFGLKGMLVEGLAQAAVHDVHGRESFPPSFFALDSVNDISHVANRMSSLALDTSTTADTPACSKRGDVHAFDIVARMLKDDRLVRKAPDDFGAQYAEVFIDHTPVVREHAETWTVDLNQPDEVERKMEELVWLGSLIYGVGGLTPNGFHASFYLMHLVTSSVFLPSLIEYLSPRSQVLLLRGHLFTILVWWAMCGRPGLNIKSFMTTAPVELPGHIAPAPKTPTTEKTPVPNPFLPILQSAITHPGEHLPKTQRALAHFDTLYGRRPAGYFGNTELEGAELLDGSLFLRTALLTANRIGWVREGEERTRFSLDGFFA